MRKCFTCGAETNRLLVCKRCGDIIKDRLNITEAERRGGLCIGCGRRVPPADSTRCVACASVSRAV